MISNIVNTEPSAKELADKNNQSIIAADKPNRDQIREELSVLEEQQQGLRDSLMQACEAGVINAEDAAIIQTQINQQDRDIVVVHMILDQWDKAARGEAF